MRREWTTKEIQFVRENYATMKPSEIAETLGRTINAVRTQANIIDVKRKVGSHPKEYVLYYLDDIIAQGTKREIVEQTGLSIHTINMYASIESKKLPYEPKKRLVRVDNL